MVLSYFDVLDVKQVCHSLLPDMISTVILCNCTHVYAIHSSQQVFEKGSLKKVNFQNLVIISKHIFEEFDKEKEQQTK